MATLTQIITFVDAGPSSSHDAVYLPQLAHFTGDLDVHDLAFDAQGRIVFVNTLFGCLAPASDTHSFTAR